MEERAFRLDFFIAIAALLVSALSALMLYYQTRVVADQYAATIWPYISVESTLSATDDRITVTNDGLGPALIKSAQLVYDGKPLASWNDYLADMTRGIKHREGIRATASLSSIGPASTIRPGDSKQLFDFSYNSAALEHAVLAHSVVLKFCYCSLNNSCWQLSEAIQEPPSENEQVAACPTHESILSSTDGLFARPTPAAR
jgi:hypothetical protein